MRMNNLIRVAIYARVSSERQAEKELSIPAQLKALKKYALGRGWDVVAEYVDEAESARSANRPAFKDMIAAAKNRVKPFDSILVWKLSRFARNREDSVIYKSLLKRRKISVLSMNEQVDETPAGSLLEGIIEVIDEFYSANLSQDTIRGMKENASRGFRNGGMLPFGYKRSSTPEGTAGKSTLTPDEREAPLVTRAFDLSAHGQGARGIAETLNAEGFRTRTGKHFRATTINHMLRNEAYVGTLVWNRYCKSFGRRQKRDDSEVIRVPDSHIPLVDKEVFAQVQALLTSRRPSTKHPKTVSSKYLLSGLAHCAKCGSTAIGANGKSGKYLYYRCNSRLTRGTSVCNAPAMNAKKLESFVLDRIKENILTEENLRQLVDLTNEEMRVNKRRAIKQLDYLDRGARSVEQKLAHVYVALESGKVDIDDLAPRLKQLRAEQRELIEKRDEALGDVNQAGQMPFDAIKMEQCVQDLRSLLQSASFLECKTFLGTFIRRIDFDRQRVGIEYTVPIPSGDELTATTEVLSVRLDGSRGRTRTCDMAVNSRPLYQLSYSGTTARIWGISPAVKIVPSPSLTPQYKMPNAIMDSIL